MGVWITCRSPAPNVIVLCGTREKRKKDWEEGEAGREGVRGEENQGTNGVSQKTRVWQLQSQLCVSQPQRNGESQKLSRYATNQTQAIPANQDVNGAGLQYDTSEPPGETEIPVTWQVIFHCRLMSARLIRANCTGDSIRTMKQTSWDKSNTVQILIWADMQSVIRLK